MHKTSCIRIHKIKITIKFTILKILKQKINKQLKIRFTNNSLEQFNRLFMIFKFLIKPKRCRCWYSRCLLLYIYILKFYKYENKGKEWNM